MILNLRLELSEEFLTAFAAHTHTTGNALKVQFKDKIQRIVDEYAADLIANRERDDAAVETESEAAESIREVTDDSNII